MEKVQVRVLRAFMPGKHVDDQPVDKPVEKDAVVTVPKFFANELVAAKKAEIVKEEIVKDEPKKPDPKPSPKPSSKADGSKKDAK